MVQVLLGYGVDVNVQSDVGDTPLDFASRSGHRDAQSRSIVD